MIYLTIVCVVSNIVLLCIIVLNSRDFMQKEDRWNEERQILLNRIQDPKYRPPLSPSEKRADMEKSKELREEFEQFGLVGKIME
jgi:hypothetical protein